MPQGNCLALVCDGFIVLAAERTTVLPLFVFVCISFYYQGLFYERQARPLLCSRVRLFCIGIRIWMGEGEGKQEAWSKLYKIYQYNFDRIYWVKVFIRIRYLKNSQ